MALKIQLISNREKVTMGRDIKSNRWFTAGSGKLFIKISDLIYVADSETLKYAGPADDKHTFTNLVYVELNNIQCQAILS